MQTDLTRPIIGIENRTAQEVFDIMCDRIRSRLSASIPAEIGGLVERLRDDYQGDWIECPSDSLMRWLGRNVRVREEAASALRALSVRNEELERALRALLDCPDIADNDHKDEETHAAERRARAALSKGGNGNG